jgi:hypothetical protein
MSAPDFNTVLDHCCAASAACTTLVLIYVLPICAMPPEFRCIG